MHRQDDDRRDDDDQQADAGHRRVRRADQTRHVTADRRDQQAGEQNEDDRNGNQNGRVVLDLRAAHEPPQQARDRNHRHEDGNDDPLAGNVLLGAVDLCAVLLGAVRGAQRLGHTADDRAHDLDERPDGSDRHDARTDETHIRLKNRRQGLSQVLRAVQLAVCVQGQQDAVGNHHADEHRDAHRHADQVTHADQSERQGGRDHRARRADLERGTDLGGRHLQVAEQGHRRRGQSAPGDRQQTALVVLAGLLGVADLEDLSACHALGVG